MGTSKLQSVPVKADARTGEAGRWNGSAEPDTGADGFTASYAGVGFRSTEPGNGTEDSARARIAVLQSEGNGAEMGLHELSD